MVPDTTQNLSLSALLNHWMASTCNIISCCCFCLYTTLLIILPFAPASYALLCTLHLNPQSCESIPLGKKVSIVHYPKRDTNCDLTAISVTDFNYNTIYCTSCTILEKKSHLCSS